MPTPLPLRTFMFRGSSRLAFACLALAGCTTMQPTAPAGGTAPMAVAAAASAPQASRAASAPGASLSGRPLAAVGPGNAASGIRAPGAPPGVVAPTGPLRPFADVIKDAKRIDGLFTLWQKDDKVWIEIKPEDLGQPFFLSPKLKTGIGERNFFGGSMADSGIVEFRRIHNQMQLLWRNIGYTADAGSPEARAVEAGYSPSLLASTVVLSNPEPARKSVLIEANGLFLSDLLGIGMDLQRAYRQGYAFDPRNSAITQVRGTPDLVVFEVMSHFATASISVPTFGAPPGAPVPSAPRSLPDPRSMFINLHYSLARLPAHVMHARKADQRVGYFDSGVFDFSNDVKRTPRVRYVNRWRLEKKDPAADLSEPVKPITYWIDRNVPVKYRAPITAGVLEWNKAFEKIGFKDAIRVEVQPDDADFDTLDFGRSSIRWMTDASPTFGAIGPSHVDPRSGEILDADIGIESLSARDRRSVRSQILSGPAVGFGVHAGVPANDLDSLLALDGATDGRAASFSAPTCTYADQAIEQMNYGLDVLEARGDLDPSGPESDRFVFDYLKDVTMHEVGHTLGLRHNFRASRVYTPRQLADPAFTAANGITGSVMEYAPINLGTDGQPHAMYGTPFNDTLGPYDYWAIEYGYKPLASGATAAEEAAALERIAGRSAEPLLAYGTDEDNSLGLDPETLQFDLGSDVIAFARARITIAQELLQRQETRQLRPDQDYSVLRRSVNYAVSDVARAAHVLARQIGGVRTIRDAPDSGRDPLSPVPVEQQRQALDLITGSLLSADSLRISPALQRRLGIDFLEREDALRSGNGSAITNYSLSSRVLDLQRAILGTMMSDTVASRLLDSAEKSPSGPTRALRISELYGRLTQALWSELGSATDIAPMRRELQRDYINRIATLLLRPGASSRSDTRSLVRTQAKALVVRLRTAEQRRGLNADTRSHLQDSADSLSEALSAKLERLGA